MATAFAEVGAMSVKSRSFTVGIPPLTAVERVAYEHCLARAKAGEQVTQDSISEAIGSRNVAGSTAAGVLNRLEEKGYIERRRYQRGVQVCIGDKCTAPPSCLTPHWRTITDRPPTPAIHQIRGRDVSLAQWIEQEARATGRDMAAFLQELVLRGVQDYRAEQECQA